MGLQKALKVLYLTAECVPFAKTGGLADVAGALPKAIRALGHDVRIMMPRYGRVEVEKFGLRRMPETATVPMDERAEVAAIYEGSIGANDGLTPVYFVDSPRYFDRQGIYMYPDDAERFIFFSRAALETCRTLGWQPDVIHCNEWHTALIPNWLKTVYRDDPFFSPIATLYTAHNLEYQGIFGYRVLEIAGLAETGFIAHPDIAGQRLDPLLRDRRDRLFGILNGIDTELYNPATDPNIAVHFDVTSIEARAANKAALQAEAGLAQHPEAPIISIVGRLIDQKGFDLINAIVDPLLRHNGCQLVVMGTGEMRYHEMLSALAARYPERVAVFLTFTRPLEQRIYAGSDIFLMPSRFEPCGLNQMVAMRYGAVPVVHRIGGLADSVTDYTPETGEGHGFDFATYDAMALYTALIRALETYRHRDIWRQLVRRCMAIDFSWRRSAVKYVDLYQRALTVKAQGQRTLADYALGPQAALRRPADAA
ncbi:MAG: Glycogen synthase [Chloroflexi bacterium ADurb.Bin325]|nr:MAG: Glycogen synthase [Chloroflexi bacterium ADurb.Bin325]